MTRQQTDVESIFAAALEIDALAQGAFLDEACGGDQPLRARLEALLRANRDAGSFLQRPAAGLAPTIAGGQHDTVDESGREISLAFLTPIDKAGCLGTLGQQYEAIEVVGHGGMGVVLRAYDTKLNRVVAIKVMAPELAVNATAVKRFLREARAAAAVSHDHVVTIHAIDEVNHPPFLVMEFVDGISLQEKIERLGGLELKEILRIGMQTAAGLAAAHRQGLVHRDIKPANILLENGVERVKITDFGLARAVDDVGVTQTGQIAGTPLFMSPEQAQDQPIDARSDLFSVGSVLYTMCTGRPPFRAETAVATLRRVCDDEPRPICKVNSEIPDWLEAIVNKLLAKDPAERFQTAAEVADLLGGHLAHLQHPATIPQPPRVESTKEPCPFNVDNELSFVESSQRVYAVKPLVERTDYFDKPLARPVWPLIAAGLAAMFVGIALLGAVIYVATDKGTLVIESDDENVEVLITRPYNDTHDGLQVSIVDRVTGSKVVRLASGHYRLLLMLGPDSKANANVQAVQLSKEQFVLRRGGKVVVKVTHTPKAGPQRIDEAGNFPGHTRHIEGVQFFADGRAISTSYDTTLRIWNVETGHELNRINTGRTLSALALSPDQKLVAVGTHDTPIEIWNLETRVKTATLAGHTDRVVYLAFTPDGRRLMSSGFDPIVRVWDLENGKELRAIKISNPDTTSLSPDGRLIVARDPDEDSKVRVWEADSGQQVKTLDTTATGKLLRTAFSSDGSQLATGSIIGVVQIWDLAGGNELCRIDAHQGPTLALAFTPDGRRLVSTGIDGALCLWDAATGHKLAEARADTRRFNNVAMSPDGRHIITGGGFAWDNASRRSILDGDNDLHLYRLPERDVPPFAPRDSRRQLTPGVGARTGETPVTNSLGITLRLIQAGEFDMGTADDQLHQIAPREDWFFADFVASRRTAETPRHRVTLTKPFYMATHEVTVGQFRRFADETGYQTTAETNGAGYGWRNAVWQKSAAFNWKNPGFSQSDDHPVCNASWADAVAFCRWLSQKEGMTYRLPTEAEWEYACRAGTTTSFSTGDDPDSLRGAANLADASLSQQEASVTWAVAWEDGYAATAPVGSFAPNAFGLYDMHGNVWEWCADEYDSAWYQQSPAADPMRRGSARPHVYRGGGWDNWPGFIRSADRYSSHSESQRTQWAGFRVVRETEAGVAPPESKL